MLAACFQFSGSLLLAYMVTFRRIKDIKSMVKLIIPIPGKPLGNSFRRLLFETWLSRTGFIYLAIGYLVQIFDINLPFSIFPYWNKNINAILVVTILFFFGLGIAKIMTKIGYSKTPPYNPDEDTEEGETKIEFNNSP